ncbi:prephenate dehydrogenase [Salinicoccus halodurans]|uniref:Prephenate dehydrogenase n=1 Tax=Salinicoccus halodurans TaxID=407035 RepID=A0A0F7HIP1_9STAP|nr:prephenate dehydrogenase [Salinicoccus halodurans]AKG72918.1 prephenate dehydrogenase [Salinicoccus halodurans]SFK76118.1 prephenate dehydrogenase [Salinicoccus halodurans]
MKIVIAGLGNIGGSFALAIKTYAPEHEIYAIDIDAESLRDAEESGLITKGYETPEEIIPEADLIIFSVYPMILKSLVASYAPYFKEGAILTDVTGIKRSIIEEIEPLLPDNVDFVFGHPMAGRENRGLAFASGEVFQGANYLFTPIPRNSEGNIKLLTDFVRKIGFKNISSISPDFHDEVIGFTSQLAHVIAVSLINSDDNDRNTKAYTGDSYRDLTRITNINEKLWPELFIMNKDHLLSHIEGFKGQLDQLTKAIENEDIETMQKMMIESRHRYHDLHNLDESLWK